jgi:hypothetical protein
MNAVLAARNPEFLRQLWLEFTPARLLGMPAVLALIGAAAGLADPDALPTVAYAGFVLLVWVYGARSASSALLDEVAEATWDAQRLSSLTPWQLTWGKLAGGTLYAWYGGAICLATWAVSTLALGKPWPLAHGVGVVATGIALQAAALIAALVAAGRGVSARRGGGWWLVLLFAWPFVGGLPFESQRVLHWWGVEIGVSLFWAASAVVFAAWLVRGAQRLMAAALQVPQRPLAWLGFLAWFAVYGAGFLDQGSGAWRVAFAGALVALVAAYAALVVEPPTLARWRRLAAAADRGTALARAPLMAVALAAALACASVATLLTADGPAPRGWGDVGLPLTWALLALRDLALACAVFWGPRPRRAESATVVLLVVLNLVLPWLLSSAGLDTLAAWLQPIGQGGAGGWLGAGIAALQAALALGLARLRWQSAAQGAA